LRRVKVAEIQFLKKEDQSWFLDPKEGFSKKCISFEIRRDDLTGHVSRILPYRRKYPEVVIPPEMLEASQKVCPFCVDQISSSTPKLLPEIASEGRIRRGGAWLFPNAFPYARYNWVIVLCEDHFLYPDQFSVEILRDGFLLAQDGIKRIGQSQPEFQHSYINWNYLPPSGAGLFHPHIQVVIEDVPTTSHKKVLEGISRYQKEGKPSFWQDYLLEEIKRGERYIGHQGDVHFLTAFSPRGIFGEIFILFSNRSTIDEVNTEDWTHFSQGMISVFQYLKSHIVSFNLSLFSGNVKGIRSWVYGRLCPRMIIPPWNISDINYFEKLHDEVMCVVSPEEFCENLKPFFTGSRDA
jgi:UDPglucose--hexose-1-phosphate uridylyltransferase